jgi:predicted dehydrogenase
MADWNGTKLGIGVVGCGSISLQYIRNASLFGEVELIACADLSAELAKTRAGEYGIEAMSVDRLLANPRVDLILNLTVPAAHFDVSMSALSAGKHVFTEKPLSTNFSDGRRLVHEAGARGLLIGSAPDTFLGAAGRLARRLVDEGAIGAGLLGAHRRRSRGSPAIPKAVIRLDCFRVVPLDKRPPNAWSRLAETSQW